MVYFKSHYRVPRRVARSHGHESVKFGHWTRKSRIAKRAVKTSRGKGTVNVCDILEIHYIFTTVTEMYYFIVYPTIFYTPISYSTCSVEKVHTLLSLNSFV